MKNPNKNPNKNSKEYKAGYKHGIKGLFVELKTLKGIDDYNAGWRDGAQDGDRSVGL